MALAPGTRIGPYEVTSKLGQGGMGEVWRARDTQLDRDVALKTLPPLLAADPERLARFEREAKTLAALNHPNIAAIYGLEKNALVMELVPGRTLDEIIQTTAQPHRGLPINHVVHIASQIAEGLEAAHEAGIVHRDLKPANIKQRDDDVVKLLDFGLARAMDSASAFSSPTIEALAASPTMLSPAVTQQGIIVGTAGYMSPEQARGRVADKRADIWAFGVVLYEMLTGRPLFSGETVTEVIATVIKDAPNLDALPADTPPQLRRLLVRCLDRDVKTRLRDIGEARVILSRANDLTTEVSLAQQPADPISRPGISRREAAAWGLAAAALVAAAVLWSTRSAPGTTHSARDVVRTAIPPPADAAFDFDVTVAPPAISPDGKTMCFGARSQNGRIQLWLRPLDSADARPIDGTEGGSFPFWSPDSKSIGFYVSSRGRIERVNLTGGTPVPVVRAGFVRGASWGKDDTIVFDSQGAIRAIPLVGGEARVVTDKGVPRSPWMLPGGKHLLYWQGDSQAIHVVGLDGSGDAAVTDATSNAIYASGHLIFMREEALLAQPFDLTKRAVSGAPIPLAKGVQQINGEPRGVFSASETGLLIYQDGGSAAQTRLEWFDGTGKRLSSESVGEVGRAKGVEISPDDRFAVFQLTDPDGGQSFVRINLSNGARNRLTVANGADVLSAFSSWSPDGRFVAYAAKRGGKLLLVKVDANGGPEETLIEITDSAFGDGLPPRLTTWSREGLFFAGNVSSRGWRAPLAPNGAPAGPITEVSAGEGPINLRLSPDGRWLAHQGASQTNAQVSGVFVQAFPSGTQRQTIADNATLPRWSHDGKSLYFADDNRLVVASATETGGSLHFGTPRAIMPVIVGRGYSYDVTKDGRILALVTSDARAMRPLTLVQGWMTAGR